MSEREELEPDMDLREALCFCADVHDCPTEADSDRLRAACDARQEAVLTLLRAHDDRIRAEAWEELARAWDEGWLASKRHERGEGQPKMTLWPNPYRPAALRVAAGTPTHHTTEEDA